MKARIKAFEALDVERRCAIRSISFGLVSFDYGITNGQLELRS